MVVAKLAVGRVAPHAALVFERADNALRAAAPETYFVAGPAGVHSRAFQAVLIAPVHTARIADQLSFRA